MERRLSTELLKLKDQDLYPLHMPGHKRNIEKGFFEESDSENENDFGKYLSEMYKIDITEIDGFDNLHDANDLIKDAEERAANLYKSSETHFLVNGSTCGILSAISAVTDRGDKIIVARNSHISLYNALELNELNPVYVYPEITASNVIKGGICGCISCNAVEKAIINNPDAKAVFITSPTYDGIISDVAGIARLAHEYDMPLIVDEAHGALFYLEGRSAVIAGADIVINSVHKTLPSLTQTALVHIGGSIVDRNKVRRYLRIYQTSSPSYILMGSIDYSVYLMEKYGSSLYRDFCIRTIGLKEALSKLRYIEYVKSESLINSGVYDFDESKVLIAAGRSGLNGKDIYNILRKEFRLLPEMAAGDYVLLMTTLFDSEEGLERLVNALYEIDRKYSDEEIENIRNIHEDDNKDNRLEELSRYKNKVSAKTIFIYPPGIPIVVRGEILTEKAFDEIQASVRDGLDVKITD